MLRMIHIFFLPFKKELISKLISKSILKALGKEQTLLLCSYIQEMSHYQTTCIEAEQGEKVTNKMLKLHMQV